MAVRPGRRRRGIATFLLSSAEELARRLGKGVLYLHSRVDDSIGTALYRKAQYVEAGRDLPLVRLVGLDPRVLLYKNLLDDGA